MLTKKIQSAGLIIFCLNLLAVIFGAFNLIPFNWDIYKGFAVATALGYILFWLTLTRISNEFKHIIKLDVEANKKQSIKPTKEFIDPWSGMKLCNRHVLSEELKMLISVSELQSKEGDAYSAAFLAWIYEYGPLEIKDYEKQLYTLLQLILREYVGSLKLDDILKMKQEISTYVLEAVQKKEEEYGVQFIHAGVKDIILPGEIKDILNTVLIAEKRAMANVITRREETASTRSLLNTAKLMEENQTLYRLKELEFLEKISENIGTISLSGKDNLLESLNTLLASKNSPQ